MSSPALTMPSNIRTFAPGARVEIRHEEWIVRATRPASTGGTAVHVTGLSELVRGKDAIFLSDLDDIVELKPEQTRLVADKSPQFRQGKLYVESLLRRTPPSDPALYVGHRGAMNLAPYQLAPAAQALAQPRPRILIADGVGLGKTIEVGILLSELIRRGRGDRILVVALKSILAQFQEELWARFTIPLVRLDSVGVRRVQARIPSNMNPFYYFNRAIISIDTLKKDAKYRRYLEKCHWDVVVVDECQHVAVRARGGSKRKSQRAWLAEMLATTCDALILTSATPHDGRPESFASLLNLLEPTAVANPAEYTRDEINSLYIRRFKKDVAHQVGGSFQERQVRLEKLAACPAEDAAFKALSEASFQTVDDQGRGVLFRTTLVKAFLSSPRACAASIRNRLRHADLAGDDAGAAHDRDVLQGLLAVVETIGLQEVTKLGRLLEWLGEAGHGPGGRVGDRVVIFSERIETLKFLEEEIGRRFSLPAGTIELFYGSLDDQRQMELVKDFGTENGEVRILLASDAASEGLNLHFFCHRLIHFDLPWSLITMEQRNGRIDRFGQERTPDIRFLLTLPGDPGLRGDLRILELLIEREQAAHKNLGDVAWLMALHDADLEAERIAQAIDRHERPEAVVPETPADTDWLALLFGAGDAATEVEAATADPPSLYADDLSFARDAIQEISDVDPRLAVDPHDHASGFTLYAPPDLQRRFAFLPRELQSDRWEFKLTTDRQRVQDALAKARQDRGRWPEWQLFWELHPIADWLNDRVQATVSRNQAPVLRVPRGIAAGSAILIFLGVASNLRSQPVAVDWFGVRTGGLPEVLSLPEILATTGLAGPLRNPVRDVPIWLEGKVADAVAVARRHMARVVRERPGAATTALAAELERVKTWHERAAAELERKRLEIEAGRPLRSHERVGFERQQSRLARLRGERESWANRGIQTAPEPYLRLAAVLIGLEEV